MFPDDTNAKLEPTQKLIFDMFCEKYQSLLYTLRQCSFLPEQKRIIFEHFDTGFLWTKEAFAVLALINKSKEEQLKLAKQVEVVKAEEGVVDEESNVSLDDNVTSHKC